MSEYILAIDQGTTGTRVVLIDASGRVVNKISHEFKQFFPQPGWVEHDLNEIWATVLAGIDELLKLTHINPQHIVAIGITNQRETVGVWDKRTHKPVHNAIVWQCRRTAERCARLGKNAARKKSIMAKTGLVLDPYFSATKLEWLIKNVPGISTKIKSGRLAAGTIDTFLIYKLTAGKIHATDVSNASRTMLMNIKTGQWDPGLLREFKVPREILPKICPSSGEFGVTKSVPGLPDGIPISGVAGDQQAALFGQACFKAGDAKCTFGTGSFILMNTGSKMLKSKAGLLTTVAWQLKGQRTLTYALEGGAFICGAAVQWLRDGLGIITDSGEVEALARQVTDTGGVYFVPAMVGLGPPYWDPQARGIISGLTRGATRAHLARATLEAMALQNVDILRAMEKDLGKKIRRLNVDGGAATNDLLMQMQADYLGSGIVRPQLIETTVAGAAYLAGLGVGFWSDLTEIKKVRCIDTEFTSQSTVKARSAKLNEWHLAIKRTHK